MSVSKQVKAALCGALAILAAGAAAVPARAQDQALIDAAKQEGELTWYTGFVVNLLVRPLADAFEAKYGIKVNYVSSSDSEMLLRLTNEARAGMPVGDVFDTPGTLVPPLKEAGLIGHYPVASAKDYPPELRDKDGYWTSIFVLYLTTGYNTDLVSDDEAPKTFQDLLDPKWKGKMVWTDTRTISGPAGFIADILATMGEKDGMDYLRRLAQQDIVGIPSNQRVVLDQVIAGQYPVGLMIYNHHTVISQAQGAPIKWVKMEPLVANVGVIALSKNAPHPNAGKLFLEFVLGEEGQTVLANAGYPPAHPAVQAKNPSITPTGGEFKTTLLTPEMTGAPLAGWLKIYDELFK